MIKSVQDFRVFLSKNRDKLLERAIKVEDIPTDDEWIQDNSWDEIYMQEVLDDEKIPCFLTKNGRGWFMIYETGKI